MAQDFYDELGVSRDAPQDEVKKAYRRLAKKYHPDVNPGDKSAETRFKQVSTAFETLGDPEKRKLYDEFGEDSTRTGFDPVRAREYARYQSQTASGQGVPFGPGGGVFFRNGNGSVGGGPGGVPGGFSFADLFDLFNQQEAAHGRDVDGDDTEHDVDLDLATALRGGEIALVVREPAVCGTCHGDPKREAACTECHGRGIVTRERTLRVRIPPRVPDGVRLRIPGEGERTPSGRAGDLYLLVRLRADTHFERDGKDLRVELPVSVPEAITGGRVGLVLPDGSRVTVRIPPGCQSGQRLRLRGLGLGREGDRGDVYARVSVKVPTVGSPELTRLAQAMQKSYRDETASPVREDIADEPADGPAAAAHA